MSERRCHSVARAQLSTLAALLAVAAGRVDAETPQCLIIGAMDVSVVGEVTAVKVPQRQFFTGFSRTFRPAYTDFTLNLTAPIQLRRPVDSTCTEADPVVTKLPLAYFPFDEAEGVIRMVGDMADGPGNLPRFYPSRVCRPGKTPECVDLDETGKIDQPWIPPRP